MDAGIVTPQAQLEKRIEAMLRRLEILTADVAILKGRAAISGGAMSAADLEMAGVIEQRIASERAELMAIAGLFVIELDGGV